MSDPARQHGPAGDDAIEANKDISVRHWLGGYLLLLLSAVICLWAMLPDDLVTRWESLDRLVQVIPSVSPPVKLLALAIYLALCTTFSPMPTGWIIAAVATQEAGLFAGRLWPTVLAVAMVGALASTVANLADYHMITLVMRSRRVSRLRQTRVYRAATQWFHRAPLLLVTGFNLLPIPVDAVRILAASARYPRLRFAIGNWMGRFLRYGLIAYVTYRYNLGWYAVVGLLGLTVGLAVGRLGWGLLQRLLRRTPNGAAPGLSDTAGPAKI